MTATTPATDGRVVWSTDEPLLDRDEVLDLFWSECRCQTVWVDALAGLFRKSGEDGLYRIRISWSLRATWEVVVVNGGHPCCSQDSDSL